MKTKLFPLYLGFWLIYFAIIWIQAVRVTPDGWDAAYLPHWADGAAHLSYMANFAYRDNFPSQHPLFLGHPYSYSFAADYLGGLLVKIGLSLPDSYNLLGFLLSAATVVCLWQLLAGILKSSGKTFLAATLFFFSGGLGWRYYLNGITRQDNFFFSLFTQIPQTPIVWLNTIVGELIPQRSFLLGLPLGCLLLGVFIRRFIYHHPVPRFLLIISGIVLGCLPVIHPHTALIITTAIAIYGLSNLIQCRSTWRSILIDLAMIGIPAAAVGFSLSSRFIFPAVTDGFFRYFPGWLARTTQTNWLLFWLDNWGLFLPLAFIGTLKSNLKTKLILAPFWLWFLLANLFLFQPYDWDNSKLLTWVYLLFTIPVVQQLCRLPRSRPAGILTAIVILVVLTFAGAADALRMLDTQTQSLKLLDNNEIRLATYLRQHTPTDAIILTSTTHRNWVPMATGRQILCGYRGWMWTYGINDATRFDDMQAIYRGTAQADRLIKQYGIDYIVVGPEENYEFATNQSYFDSHYSVFYQTATTTIYQVN